MKDRLCTGQPNVSVTVCEVSFLLFRSYKRRTLDRPPVVVLVTSPLLAAPVVTAGQRP